MDRTILLDEKHFHTAVSRAKALGTTPGAYVQSLIDGAGKSFDEILEPVRKGFVKYTDKELEEAFDRAQKAARGKRRKRP